MNTDIQEPISGSIADSQMIDFTLPTDISTNITVTLTSIMGVRLIFRTILISAFYLYNVGVNVCIVHYLDTTDIQDLLVSECPGGGGINVSIVYVEGTLSPGALVCVLPINDGAVDIAGMRLVAIPLIISSDFTLPDLSGGEYRVVAFDLENDTLPKPVSMAADTDVLRVSGDKGTCFSSIKCTPKLMWYHAY